MARTPLLARISLDEVICNRESDDFSAEPYLWTVFFKIDGDSVVVGDNTFLQGKCTIVANDGSHGNLGDHDVDAGDTVVVPRRIGEFRTTLRPIPHSNQEAHPGKDAPGGLGVVLVLMEENLVSDAGARAGYAALVEFVRNAINNDIIPKLFFGNQEVDDKEINDRVDEAIGTIEDAMKHVQSAGQNFWSWVDKDRTIGFRVLRVTQDALADNYWDINERLLQVRQDNGAVVENWQVTGESQGVRPSPYNYTHLRRSQDLGTPPTASAPTTCLHPAQGVQNIVYRDSDGHLHELWRDNIGQIGTTDLTAWAGAGPATGDPSAYLETTTDLEIALYRDSGGGVHSLYWSTGVPGLDNLSLVAGSPAADGNPMGHYNPATNTHHVVYRSHDSHLHVLYWTGADDPAHYDGPLTEMVAGVPLAAGDPSAYFTTGGENVVVYRASDRHIHSLYWSTGEVGHADLSGTANPPAVGDPVACYIPSLDLHQVTYRTEDGRLYELSWRGQERAVGRDLMEPSDTPEAVSDPAVFYSAATNTTHVIYRGPFGHLFELWFVPGGQPTVVDLTLAALAPRAVDHPSAFTVDAANLRYVVYRGFDNQIHEISWTANPWATPGRQTDWRWCNRCQGLFYGGLTATSRCPAGGTHTPAEQSGSADYVLPHGVSSTASSQRDWRWCDKCQGLFIGGNTAQSVCPAGSTHTPSDQSGSWDYVLPYGVPGTPTSQHDWRWCNRCQGLFYGGNITSSRCPTGGTHSPPNQSGSADYVLPHLGVLQ